MNLPPSAALRNRPGAPSAQQLEQGLAQMSSRAAAMSPAGQSQMLSGVRESLKEGQMVPDTGANLAQQFLLDRVANLKKMAGVSTGAEQMVALGSTPQEVMARIGM